MNLSFKLINYILMRQLMKLESGHPYFNVMKAGPVLTSFFSNDVSAQDI